jgi:hypothetical protein
MDGLFPISHLFFGLDVFVAQLALLFAAVFAWHLFFMLELTNKLFILLFGF